MSEQEMDIILEKILNYIPQNRNWRFSFCGLGEPLMHPKLEVMLSRPLLQKFKNIDLITNGTLLDENNVHILAKCLHKRTIRVSLQSADKNQMESLQFGAKFECVIKNICHLIDHNNDFQCIWIQKMITPENQNDMNNSRLEELGIRAGPRVKIISKTCVDILGRHSEQKLPRPHINIPCNRFGEDIIINSYGDWTVCCWDSTRSQVLGNIIKQSFTDSNVIERKNELKNSLEKGEFENLPICKMCLAGR